MVAFSIPPAINPEIRTSPLSDISGLHVHASSRPDVLAYRDAVLGASDEELELARPQLYFVCNDLKSRLVNACSEAASVIENARTPMEVASKIFGGVYLDARNLLAECDASPRNKNRARHLAGAYSYLAEIEAFARSLAEGHDPSFSGLAKEAAETVSALGREIDEFRGATKERYPEISATLPSSADMRKASANAVRDAALSAPRLSADRLDRIMGDCGDHGELWAIASGQSRQKYIESGRYRPLNKRDADSLRGKVSGLLADYDDVFNGTGFIAQLRQLAVALRFQGLSYISRAGRNDEASIRRSRKGLYESAKEHAANIKRMVAQLPRERERTLAEGGRALSTSNMLSGFLGSADRYLNPGKSVGAFLEFSRHDGCLVGIPDVSSEHAMLVYDDHVLDRTIHPNAVYAVRVPATVLANGIPTLEEARGHEDWPGTNYHSVQECLGEFDNEIEQNYFFGGTKIVGHDGFDLITPPRLSRPVEVSDEDEVVPAVAF